MSVASVGDLPDWACPDQVVAALAAEPAARAELLRKWEAERTPNPLLRWADMTLPEAPAGRGQDRREAALLLFGPERSASPDAQRSAEQEVHDIAVHLLWSARESFLSQTAPTLRAELDALKKVVDSARELKVALSKLGFHGTIIAATALTTEECSGRAMVQMQEFERVIAYRLIQERSMPRGESVLQALAQAAEVAISLLKPFSGRGHLRLWERLYGDPRRELITRCYLIIRTRLPLFRLSAREDGLLIETVWAMFLYAFGPQAEASPGIKERMLEIGRISVPNLNKQSPEKIRRMCGLLSTHEWGDAAPN